MAKYSLLGAVLLLAGLCHGLDQQAAATSTSASCSQRATPTPGYYDETKSCNSILVNNVTRSFAVYVPQSYQTGTPIKTIIDFHGAGDTPTDQYGNSRYFANPTGKNYLVIYPLGINNIWQVAPNSKADDIGFIQQLLPYIQTRYNIDPTHIFASGKSQGAGFVDFMACSSLGDKFAAFAMASSALYKHATQSSCNYVKSRKMLESHGAIDAVIPYGGCPTRPGWTACDKPSDEKLPFVDDWTWWWAQAEGYTTRQTLDTNTSTYDFLNYSGASGHGTMQHYFVQNLGHCWPQTAGPPYNTDYTRSMNHDNSTGPNKLECYSFALGFTDKVVSFFEAAV